MAGVIPDQRFCREAIRTWIRSGRRLYLNWPAHFLYKWLFVILMQLFNPIPVLSSARTDMCRTARMVNLVRHSCREAIQTGIRS
nr:unnamed protein product [Haemonchus contortus]